MKELLLALPFLFLSCTSRTSEISDLIKNGRYNEAKAQILTLSLEERSTPEIKQLTAEADVGTLLKGAQARADQKLYDQALDSVLNNIEQFRSYSSLIDTLYSCKFPFKFDPYFPPILTRLQDVSVS